MNKDNWPRIQERYEAWWQGELLDRPLIRITAPKVRATPEEVPTEEGELVDWFTNPEKVFPRLERRLETTYWAGDAFPLAFPVAPSLVAIEAAYLGCPYRVMPISHTAWVSPIIEDWGSRPSLAVDPDNEWWCHTQQLLEEGAKRSQGRYCVGIPDLQGGGEILALLRGTERLAVDLYDRPEVIVPALEEINRAWRYYYDTCFEIIHRWSDGYVDWLGVWSDSPAVAVECDFAALISPQMFRAYFLPALEQQVNWIGRTVFHLDGPGSLPHLDTLLALDELNGIQWGPGAGAAPMSEWIPLLQRIQEAGKLQVLYCQDWEVEPLLAALEPEGILLSTACGSVREANALEKRVDRLFGVKE